MTEYDEMDFCGELCLYAENRIKEAMKPKLIPVTERLPEKEGTYVVRTKTGAVTTARFYDERTFPPTHYRPTEYKRTAGWSRNRHVTHWMPLPEPPED